MFKLSAIIILTVILSIGGTVLVLASPTPQHSMLTPLSVYKNGADGYLDIYDCYPASHTDEYINVLINIDGDTAYYECVLVADVVGMGTPFPGYTPQLKPYITAKR